MKFSAQEEYGLRCLITIGRGEDSTIPEVARREGLTEPHVAKLLSILRKEGFVASTRGQSGGYALARPASEIMVSEVIEVLGGPLYDETFCDRHSGTGHTCSHTASCTIRGLWAQVQDAVDSVLANVSLQDVIEGESEMDTEPVTEFPVVLTPEAIAQAKRMHARKAVPDSFVRIGVKGGGCSGLEYVMKVDTRVFDGDLVRVEDDLCFRIDPKSAKYLVGSTLRYTGNLIGGGFEFDNPNASRSCGCGTSFVPKEPSTA